MRILCLTLCCISTLVCGVVPEVEETVKSMTLDTEGQRPLAASLSRQEWEVYMLTADWSLDEKVTGVPRALKKNKDEVISLIEREIENTARDKLIFSSFVHFADKYAKQYKTKAEAWQKFNNFRDNVINAYQTQKADIGSATYGITQFFDQSREDFKKTFLSFDWKSRTPVSAIKPASQYPISNKDIPESIDWRTKGAVTPVKDQGNCGSCWAFSTTGNIEGAWFLAKNDLVSLSEQELLDCDSLDEACNGGLPSQAYQEIIRLGGLENENDYPYEHKKEPECHIHKSDIAVYINDSVILDKNEETIKAWVAEKGPVSIGLNANTLQFYRGGIAHPWKIFCEPFMLNHGVLIVGYGTEGTKPFWIIKNSWAETFGEKGYFRMYRGKNVCGVAEMATSAIVL